MQTGNGKRILATAFGILLMLVLVLAVSTELIRSYRVERKHSLDSALRLHWIIARSINAIESGCTTRQEFAERLLRYFDRLTDHPDIVRIALAGSVGDGFESGIAVGKTKFQDANLSKMRGAAIHGEFVFVSDIVSNRTEAEPEMLLSIVIPRPPQSTTLRQEGNRLLVTLIFGGIAITLLVLCALFRLRIIRLNEEMRLANRKQGRIEEMGLAAAGLAHETKNPLGIIRGLAQQISDHVSLPDEIRAKASDIMEEADVTAARLGEFLNYAKLRTPVLQPVEARPLVERLANLIRGDVDDAGITLKIVINDLVILGDPEMLSQVLMNLLDNSLKSTPDGGTISVLLKKVDHTHAFLVIHDTGRGIDPDFLPNLFKPYSSRRSGGYGIGMAIVKRIVEESGWEIHVESKLGKGTETTISGIRIVAAALDEDGDAKANGAKP